jgi:hypothetical protein
MIKFENFEVMGWEHAIRGMRNPLNSWEKSDSHVCVAESTAECDICDHLLKRPGEFSLCRQPIVVGPNDLKLATKLRNAGTDHRKFMRMITVYVDITAPLYWWKEFDTYKVGTVANSCSTMHTIHEKEFTWDDFSVEKLLSDNDPVRDPMTVPMILDMNDMQSAFSPAGVMQLTIDMLNANRVKYLETNDKIYWENMIQMLPTSFNQKRTVQMNYEVLANIYKSRKNHKLTEWRLLCEWAAALPYGELITGEEE